MWLFMGSICVKGCFGKYLPIWIKKANQKCHSYAVLGQ